MSIFKKIKSIANNGIEPIVDGMSNYKKNIAKVEALAKERADVCKGCDDFVKEPIPMFKIKDERIPELSNKMCDICSCASPYLLRQNIKICKKWKK